MHACLSFRGRLQERNSLLLWREILLVKQTRLAQFVFFFGVVRIPVPAHDDKLAARFRVSDMFREEVDTLWVLVQIGKVDDDRLPRDALEQAIENSGRGFRVLANQ